LRQVCNNKQVNSCPPVSWWISISVINIAWCQLGHSVVADVRSHMWLHYVFMTPPDEHWKTSSETMMLVEICSLRPCIVNLDDQTSDGTKCFGWYDFKFPIKAPNFLIMCWGGKTYLAYLAWILVSRFPALVLSTTSLWPPLQSEYISQWVHLSNS